MSLKTGFGLNFKFENCAAFWFKLKEDESCSATLSLSSPFSVDTGQEYKTVTWKEIIVCHAAFDNNLV